MIITQQISNTMKTLNKLVSKAISFFNGVKSETPKPSYSLSKILIIIDRKQGDIKALSTISDLVIDECHLYPRIQFVLIMKTINSKLSDANQGFENESDLVLA